MFPGVDARHAKGYFEYDCWYSVFCFSFLHYRSPPGIHSFFCKTFFRDDTDSSPYSLFVGGVLPLVREMQRGIWSRPYFCQARLLWAFRCVPWSLTVSFIHARFHLATSTRKCRAKNTIRLGALLSLLATANVCFWYAQTRCGVLKKCLWCLTGMYGEAGMDYGDNLFRMALFAWASLEVQ